MAQTTGRLYDELAKLMNDAAGVATGVRRKWIPPYAPRRSGS